MQKSEQSYYECGSALFSCFINLIAHSHTTLSMDHNNIIIVMRKSGLNNQHPLPGVPRRQQLQHAFLHAMHTLVNKEIAHTEQKDL